MTIEDRMALPAPGWDPLTEEHWFAAGAGRLVIQRCARCGHHRWPPSWACHACQSTEWTWDELPGTGILFTFTWADFRPEGTDPYCIAVIELDGVSGAAVRLATRLIEVERSAVQCGMRVAVVFERVDEEISIPFFRPSAN